MKELVPIEDQKDDAYSRILDFYKNQTPLRPSDEVILSRWLHCDALQRSRKFKEPEILKQLKDKFAISIHTAQDDFYKTHMLMGVVRRVSKQNLLLLHAEDIALQIERIKHDKSLVYLLPKLMDSYTRAIAALPEDKGKNILPPPIFIFNTVEGKSIKKPLTSEDARAKAKEILAKKAEPKQYDDFEDLPDETT